MRRCRGSGFVRTRGQQDFVSDADLAADALIRKPISDRFPGEPVLSEKRATFGPVGADGRSTGKTATSMLPDRDCGNATVGAKQVQLAATVSGRGQDR